MISRRRAVSLSFYETLSAWAGVFVFGGVLLVDSKITTSKFDPLHSG